MSFGGTQRDLESGRKFRLGPFASGKVTLTFTLPLADV